MPHYKQTGPKGRQGFKRKTRIYLKKYETSYLFSESLNSGRLMAHTVGLALKVKAGGSATSLQQSRADRTSGREEEVGRERHHDSLPSLQPQLCESLAIREPTCPASPSEASEPTCSPLPGTFGVEHTETLARTPSLLLGQGVSRVSGPTPRLLPALVSFFLQLFFVYKKHTVNVAGHHSPSMLVFLILFSSVLFCF